MVKTLRLDLLDGAAAAAAPARRRLRRRSRSRRDAGPRRRPRIRARSRSAPTSSATTAKPTGRHRQRRRRMNREGYRLRADRVIWNRGHRRGPGRGQCPRRQPGGRRRLWRQRRARPTRCATAWSRTCCSCSRMAAGSPPSAARARRTATPPSTAPPTRPARWSTRMAARRTRPGRSPRSGSSTIRSGTGSPTRARRLNLFGTPIIGLPGLSHPDGSQGGGSGLLVPDIRLSRTQRPRAQRCLIISGSRPTATRRSRRTSTPTCCRCSRAEYRQLTDARRLPGRAAIVTYGSRIADRSARRRRRRRTRASAAISRAMAASSSSPIWSVTALGPLRHRPHLPAPLRHLARRPAALDGRCRADQRRQLHLDRRLGVPGPARHRRRRASSRSRCRRSTRAGGWPIRWLGGRVELQANSLAILRTEGQDTQRAFASARWDRRSITPLGQELAADRLCPRRRLSCRRHRADRRRSSIAARRAGSGRVIGALAADVRWPFVGALPRRHPAADAARPARRLAADRESRHPQRGCARGRPRGFQPVRAQPLPRLRPLGGRRARHLRRRLGGRPAGRRDPHQYRPELPPQPAGRASSRRAPACPDRFSDIVGRTSVQVGRKLNLVHRFRLDKDNLRAPPQRDRRDGRRPPDLCDDRLSAARPRHRPGDRGSARPRGGPARRPGRASPATGRCSARRWSTSPTRREDPLSLADGFEPVRHRLGIAYDDDCIEIGVTWRRDYETTGDVRRGNTFLFRVALEESGPLSLAAVQQAVRQA